MIRPPGFEFPVGPPPETVAAVELVGAAQAVPRAPPPASLLALPRNLARFLIGYEDAVNTINKIRDEYETVPTSQSTPELAEPDGTRLIND